MAVTSFGKDMGPLELKAIVTEHILKASSALDSIKSFYLDGWMFPVSPYAEDVGESYILDMERNCAVAFVALEIMAERGYNLSFVVDALWEIKEITSAADKYIREALSKEYAKTTSEYKDLKGILSHGIEFLESGKRDIHGLDDY